MFTVVVRHASDPNELATCFAVLRQFRPLGSDEDDLDPFRRLGVELTDEQLLVDVALLDGIYWLDHRCDLHQCTRKFMGVPRERGFQHFGVTASGTMFSIGRSLWVTEDTANAETDDFVVVAE